MPNLMELMFSDVSQKKEISKAIDLIVTEDTIFLPGEEVKVLEAIEFHGRARTVEDTISLEGEIRTKLELECSRCLNNFSIDVVTDIDEKFSNNIKEDESIAYIEGDVLDVSEAIVSNVISTLPIKRLCDEQCKGLCQSCGADLNLHKCHCNDSNIDIRFEKLKELFEQ
ncbi:MAG: YceD family protein [Sarcina sp.]